MLHKGLFVSSVRVHMGSDEQLSSARSVLPYPPFSLSQQKTKNKKPAPLC